MSYQFDFNAADCFLKRVCGDSLVTFQTFPDRDEPKGIVFPGILHGWTRETLMQLVEEQKKGAGVFVMARTSAWRLEDILATIERLANEGKNRQAA